MSSQQPPDSVFVFTVLRKWFHVLYSCVALVSTVYMIVDRKRLSLHDTSQYWALAELSCCWIHFYAVWETARNRGCFEASVPDRCTSRYLPVGPTERLFFFADTVLVLGSLFMDRLGGPASFETVTLDCFLTVYIVWAAVWLLFVMWYASGRLWDRMTVQRSAEESLQIALRA